VKLRGRKVVGFCEKEFSVLELVYKEFILPKLDLLYCRDVYYVQVIIIVNCAGLGLVICSEPSR
jgi:hypothetical protein